MFESFFQCMPRNLSGKIVAFSVLSLSTNTPASKTRAEKLKRPTGDEELFEKQCLKRQMFVPKVPYPAWDYNWDRRVLPKQTDLEGHRTGAEKEYSRNKKTRHIILVRHGQYDETFQDDAKRILTPLGRLQATKTGLRLAEWARGTTKFKDNSFNGPCPINAKIRVSSMTRAKETAQLIAKELGLAVDQPDPLLNEALPAPMIPMRNDIQGATEEIDANQERIERAFQKFFFRSSDEDLDDEFEIIVCHGNVIRYFFCRALQLPPEAWLRMSIFNCSISYLMVRPNGTVSARLLGDIGHLAYDESTFSGFHGFKW